jgi:hypothetical protein
VLLVDSPVALWYSPAPLCPAEPNGFYHYRGELFAARDAELLRIDSAESGMIRLHHHGCVEEPGFPALYVILPDAYAGAWKKHWSAPCLAEYVAALWVHEFGSRISSIARNFMCEQ